MRVSRQRAGGGSGVHRSSINFTLYSLSFTRLLFPTPPFAVPDFDVALLVMPYFSWLLNPNGKYNVTKLSLRPKCTDLTFYVTLKDGGTIWR